MRIWDVSPGYLSRQRLLGEHRELHGLESILVHDKRGYSRHPETVRWVGCRAALCRRHDLLSAEMALRGYCDKTPVTTPPGRVQWPRSFVTAPGEQYALLRMKYAVHESGRIPLPRNAQELWAHHKYSVMARDPELYRSLGRRVARMTRGRPFDELATELVEILRVRPRRSRVLNAAEHMWGYVRAAATPGERLSARESVRQLLQVTCEVARRLPGSYVLMSTALTELPVYLDERD